jgi:hypothetical protein
VALVEAKSGRDCGGGGNSNASDIMFSTLEKMPEALSSVSVLSFVSSIYLM